MHATCSYGEDGARLGMGEVEIKRGRGIEAETTAEAAKAAGDECGEKRGFAGAS